MKALNLKYLNKKWSKEASLANGFILIIIYFLFMKMVIVYEGVEMVGLWSLTVGMVSLARLLDFTGSAALTRIVAISDAEKRHCYIDTLVLFSMFFYTIVAACMYFPVAAIIIDTVGEDLSSLIPKLIFLSLAAIILSVTYQNHAAALDGLELATTRSAIGIFCIFIYGAVGVVCIPYYGVVSLAFAQILQFLFGIILCRLVLRKTLHSMTIIPSYFSFKNFKEIYSYGVKLQINSLTLLAFDVSSRYLISVNYGLSVLAYYDISYKLAGHTRGLVQSYFNPLIPKYANQWSNNPREAFDTMLKDLKHYFLPTSGIFACVLLILPLISLFYFQGLSETFLLTGIILNLAWWAATCTLIMQIFCKSVNVLSWTIIGHFALLSMSLGTLYFISEIFDLTGTFLLFGAGIFTSHAIMFYGSYVSLKKYLK